MDKPVSCSFIAFDMRFDRLPRGRAMLIRYVYHTVDDPVYNFPVLLGNINSGLFKNILLP